MSCNTAAYTFYLGADPILLARVKTAANAYITQAGLSSISRTVYFTSPTPEAGPTALTIANVVYDTLQTDEPWTYDDTGYNFRDTPPYSIFDAAGTWKVKYIFTTTGGTRSVVWFVLNVLDPTPT